MSHLFQRQCVVIVDTVEVSELRCTFKVTKPAAKPNTAEVVISNLSAETREKINRKGAPLILKAGYTGSLATIFSGVVRTVDPIRDGTEWNTTIRSGDGERAYRYANVSNSYKAGTPMKAVLTDLVKSLGLDTGNSAEVFAAVNSQAVNGYVAHGKSARILDEVLGGLGMEWSIQDGRVQVLKKGDATKDEAVVLGPDSGLLGSPQLGSGNEKNKPAGLVKVKCLLQARLKPGGKVSIDSEGVKGVFRIISLTHGGDTHGGDWCTEFEAAPAPNSKVAA